MRNVRELVVMEADTTLGLWKRKWGDHCPLIRHDGVDFSFVDINSLVESSVSTGNENVLKKFISIHK